MRDHRLQIAIADRCGIDRTALLLCCPYCPFAKHHESADEHCTDQRALERFLDWTEGQQGKHQLPLLFTPWGEALIHRRYQQAFVRLSHLPHVKKVAIQTDLSCRL